MHFLGWVISKAAGPSYLDDNDSGVVIIPVYAWSKEIAFGYTYGDIRSELGRESDILTMDFRADNVCYNLHAVMLS